MLPVSPQPIASRDDGSFAVDRVSGSHNSAKSLSQVERVRIIRDTMFAEADAIRAAESVASTAAVEAATRIAACTGSVVLTGVGKAGWIAQKIVATLASTGSPSHFLHPSEAIHGDLGRVQGTDIVIAFSNSGRSEEVVRVCEHLKTQANCLIAITADDANPLAEMADLVVPMGRHREACPNGLAPTTSTSVMLAIGDAIAMLASQLRGFGPQDFARFHPGGALGRKLANVDDVMRGLHECRIASETLPVRDAIAGKTPDRRSGAVMLVDSDQKLTGIFTDSDLVKLLQRRQENSLDQPIKEVMTRTPVTIRSGTPLAKAVTVLSQRHISELPVIHEDGHPIGMIDITDLITAGDISTCDSTATVLPLIPPTTGKQSS
ncbi:KpsF/GutQ family sugar-phosphate isomerase [Aporhodopirellula aestuarii]|uniref:KpsF/GutQ family sugar-phosphate isomerase n=1 Tax=Aporhodopirellula aestuarii TaxID=2950107 RepID=A0ABT0U8K8_9BACT|nr:KpsF/GutQ family sugar-phosphate isomerase [Aporhodopirellula aestuarii]MCM2373216.1 KpsF/GutQ family sugar-phosphate isomerase [Aporhodopirellula aestuarii]